MLVLASWGSPRTILSCLGEIDEALGNLSTEDFRRVLRGVNSLFSWLRDGRNRKDGIKLAPELKRASGRALAVMSRRRGASWQSLARRMVESGQDPGVVEAGLEINMEELLRGKNNWQEILESFEISFSRSIDLEIYSLRVLRRHSRLMGMPVDVAKKVTSNPERYPNFLIAVAEEVCRQDVARGIVPVATVASGNKWFLH